MGVAGDAKMRFEGDEAAVAGAVGVGEKGFDFAVALAGGDDLGIDAGLFGPFAVFDVDVGGPLFQQLPVGFGVFAAEDEVGVVEGAAKLGVVDGFHQVEAAAADVAV